MSPTFSVPSVHASSPGLHRAVSPWGEGVLVRSL